MNETHSRRQLVAMIGGTAATAIAGCSGSSDTGSTPEESGNTSVFDRIEAVGIDGEARVELQISLVEDHNVDRVALQNAEGAELLSASVSPEETRVDLTIQDDFNEPVSPGRHEVIAYNGERTIETAQWEATREITVTEVRLYNSSGRTSGLEFKLSNTGDLYVTPEDGFVSEGYPFDNNNDEPVGNYSVSGLSAMWPGFDDRWATLRSYPNTDVIADKGQCTAEEMTMVVTLTFEEIDNIDIEITLTPGGEYLQDGCTDTELINWQTI